MPRLRGTDFYVVPPLAGALLIYAPEMLSITPCIWYDGAALDAANFYVDVIPNSRIVGVQHAPIDDPAGKAGDVLTVRIELNGQPFTLLNGGPGHPVTDAVSFQLDCQSQDEVDRLWAAFTAEGQEVMCGWLTDKFGVSWQVVPIEIDKYLNGDDKERSARAMAEMMTMIKLDVNRLREVYFNDR